MSRWGLYLTGIFFAFVVCFMIYNAVNVPSKVELDIHGSVDKLCTWHPSDPVIYNLKTKLGVNYDAGHWFHMSENFMTQHSILRAKNQLADNASTIYYNFDKDGFINNLNGITRLMVYLGTASPKFGVSKINFVYMKHAKQQLPMVYGSSVILDRSMIAAEQVIDMSPNVKPQHRFAAGESSGSSSAAVCAKYMGSIGGLWPTPQRGHWFPNSGDIESFRQKIRDACPPSVDLLKTTRKTKKFKLVVYQRDLSRRLANEEEALLMMREQLKESDWEIQVLMHSSKRSPCELAHLLYNADFLVTPHGFQSMLLMFLPRPAVIFEIFPYRYFKRGYGPFGNEYGVIHSGVMSPGMTWHTRLTLSFVTTDWCMVTKSCRTYARNQDVKLTANGVAKMVEVVRSHPEMFGTTDEQRKIVTQNRDYLYND